MSQSVIGALRVNLGLDSAQFARGAREAETTARRLGRQMRNIGAAVSVVGTGVALAVRGQLGAIDDLAKSAQRMGLSVEVLSQLQHAADLSDVSLSDLQTALQRLSRNMAEDAQVFEDFGVAVRDASGELRPTQDVLADIAEVFASMPDGAAKTAAAMDLMGRSGADMIPLLNGGRDALREMMDEADRLGLTVTEETAKAVQQFNDNITRLGAQAKGFTRIITAELAPFLEKISEMVVGFAQSFQGLSPEMKTFIAILAGVTTVLGPVLIGIGLLLMAIGAPALGLIALVATATAGIIAFWDEIVGFGAAIIEFKDRMIELGRDGIQFVIDRVGELITWVAELPARFREAGANMMRGLAEGILEHEGAPRGALENIARGSVSLVRRILRIESPSRVFHEIGGNMMQGWADGIREGAQGPIAAVRDVSGQVVATIEQVNSAVASSFENAFVGIVTGTVKAKDAIRSLLQELAKLAAQSAFRGLFGSLFGGGGGGGLLSFIFGGARAAGGPVSTGKSYLVGERGPELFTPGASGNITPNHEIGGGGKSQLVIRLDPGLRAEMQGEMQGVAVQVVQEYDRSVLPGSMRRVTSDPRRMR